MHAKAGTAQRWLKQHFGSSERPGDLDRTGSRFKEEELVREVAEVGISASDDDEDAENGENVQGQAAQAQATTATFSNIAQQFICDVDNDEDEDDLELDAAGIQLQ